MVFKQTEDQAVTSAFWIGTAAGLLIGFLCMAISSSLTNAAWEKLVIKYGAGQYNPESGNFEWLGEKNED